MLPIKGNSWSIVPESRALNFHQLLLYCIMYISSLVRAWVVVNKVLGFQTSTYGISALLNLFCSGLHSYIHRHFFFFAFQKIKRNKTAKKRQRDSLLLSNKKRVETFDHVHEIFYDSFCLLFSISNIFTR